MDEISGLLKNLGGEDDGEGGSLFSSFHSPEQGGGVPAPSAPRQAQGYRPVPPPPPVAPFPPVSPAPQPAAVPAQSSQAGNEQLLARIAALEAHVASMSASNDLALAAENRLGALADRLSTAETALNRLALRSGLQEKLGERDAALLRGRVDKLEVVSVTGADLEKQIATVGELACSFIKLEAEVRDLARLVASTGGFEAALKDLTRRMDSLEQQGVYVRKLEADRDDAGKRLLKLEAASEAVIAEQAKAAETAQSEGAAIEELRAKFQNMAVIFDHIRRPLESAANKIIESALKHPADEDRR